VQKTVTTSTATIMTDYLDGFQYVNYALNFFPHAEGYVDVKGTNAEGYKFFYVYNYTDHLGNIRVSYGFDPDTKTVKTLEENHYYPFGLKHTNYNTYKRKFTKEDPPPTDAPPTSIPGLVVFSIKQVVPGELLVNKYKYNGKEWQDELGLNMYDYGARNYDPALGRYFTIDNFSEAFYNINPYQYTANNPVKFIDVNGDYIYIYGEDGTGYRYDKGKTYSQDKDGNWNEYSAKEGSYVAQIVGALNDITQGDENFFGSQFLNLFANDDVNVNVKNNVSKDPKVKDRNITQGTTIYTSFNQKESVPTTDGMQPLSFNITLAHELAPLHEGCFLKLACLLVSNLYWWR
jgi:RHS repeat-associated protein